LDIRLLTVEEDIVLHVHTLVLLVIIILLIVTHVDLVDLLLEYNLIKLVVTMILGIELVDVKMDTSKRDRFANPVFVLVLTVLPYMYVLLILVIMIIQDCIGILHQLLVCHVSTPVRHVILVLKIVKSV
jgi:hypothetical protein